MANAEHGADREQRYALPTGIEVFVREWGAEDAPPLLILHGGAHSSSEWAAVAAQLADAYRCIVPDARGHGQSSWSEAGDYACDAQVEDLCALLDVLGVERLAIAGHSMGGLNALRLAGDAPGRVTALVLIDVGSEGRKEALDHVAKARAERMAEPAPTRAPAGAPGFDVRLIEHVPTYCGDGAERRRLMHASGAPVLVLRGARSRILSHEHALATAVHVGGQLVEIPGAGHNVAAHNPEAVAGAIRAFLAAHAD